MNKTKVSVIILSYNTKQLLRECLKSVVQSAKCKVQNEIIIVDNGSTDGSVEMVEGMVTSDLWLAASGPKIKKPASSYQSPGTSHQSLITLRLIKNSSNLGFAGGNNQAAKVAKGEYLFFLNSDTVVKNDAISKLVSYLNEHQEIVAVAPLLLNEDGSVQKDPCYLKFPFPLFIFIYYNRILKFIANNLFPGLIYSTQNFSTPNIIAQLPGAALMIRKEIFEKIEGFEESFSHFFEDVDLSYRLQKDGHMFYLVPEAKIIHLGRKSLESKIKKEGIESLYYINFKALFQFCQKNYTHAMGILIKIIIFFHLLFRFRINLIYKLYFG